MSGKGQDLGGLTEYMWPFPGMLATNLLFNRLCVISNAALHDQHRRLRTPPPWKFGSTDLSSVHKAYKIDRAVIRVVCYDVAACAQHH